MILVSRFKQNVPARNQFDVAGAKQFPHLSNANELGYSNSVTGYFVGCGWNDLSSGSLGFRKTDAYMSPKRRIRDG